ncbi:MAG: pentapeptide repeat-containing protein [Pyrinomonadaceae bacterium]
MDLKMDLKDIASLITAFVAIVGSVLAVTKYLSRRDKQLAAQQAFRGVLDSLSSAVERQRLGGAILLRRFFDPETELGEGGTPYAREAVDVIAALLRETETGNFQKLLADGLLYASSLESVDLQRTNLRNAYLGDKSSGVAPNLKRADFYRADLSAASLKGANAEEAVFYQARLHNTVFKGTNLIGASFFEADLLGANFSGAKLLNANFIGARNIPKGLIARIAEDGTYCGPETFPRETQSASDERPKAFISKPGTLNVLQQELVREVTWILAEENIDATTVERGDYPSVGAVSEVRRVLIGCSGALIIAFRQLEVTKGKWRSGTEEAKSVEDVFLPTTWNHVEAGMAAMAGLPTLFLVERGVIGGLFELGDIGHSVTNLDLLKPNHDEIRRSIEVWAHSVREVNGH